MSNGPEHSGHEEEHHEAPTAPETHHAPDTHDHHDAPAVDPHHAAPAADSHHATPAADPHHAAPAADPHHAAPAADPHHAAPAADSHHTAPAADSHHTAPAADPHHAAPAADPHHAAPAADPHHAAPAADPHHAAPAADPHHAAPAADPHHAAPAADPHHADHAAGHAGHDAGHDTGHDAGHGDSHGHGGHGHGSMWDTVVTSVTTTAKNTWDTLTHIDNPNHDPIPTETKEVSGWMTPVAMTKSMIRGSVTNVLKRAGESISPLIDAGEAAFYTVTSPILHPIETADNFGEYLSHPKRIITATARAVKNVLKAPITLANEAYQGIVQRPLEQLNHKVKKIPLIGGIIAGTSNLAAKVLGWPLKFMDRKAKEWTTWIDEADEKTKGQQAGHLAKTNYAPVPATLAVA